MIARMYVRALIADGDTAHQLAAKRSLEAMGCWVDTAAEGQVAVALSRTVRYDVIFVDGAILRALEGTRVLRTLEDGGRRICVVAMGENDLAWGADNGLQRPVTAENIQAAMNQWKKSLPPRHFEAAR